MPKTCAIRHNSSCVFVSANVIFATLFLCAIFEFEIGVCTRNNNYTGALCETIIYPILEHGISVCVHVIIIIVFLL